jgi:hypothetical protein
MDAIDVHDLSDEEAKLVAEFVEFMRQRKKPQVKMRQQEKIEDIKQAPPVVSFAAWPLGVKDTLSREEIYDHL